MQNAKIFLVEDSEDQRKNLRLALEHQRIGHKVVLEASTLDQALDLVRNGSLERIGVNVAILDGSLDATRPGCSDGRAVADAIREGELSVAIIARSAHDELLANYGDFYLYKASSIDSLLAIIASLP